MGVIVLFNTISTLVTKFRADGNAENDALNLSNRADQQQNLFEQWANQIGITSGKRDWRLDDPKIKPVVESNLLAIYDQLRLVNKALKCYGAPALVRSPSPSPTPSPSPSPTPTTTPDAMVFIGDPKHSKTLPIRPRRHGKGPITPVGLKKAAKKGKWMFFGDKQKQQGVVTQLESMVAGLGKLLTPLNSEIRHAMGMMEDENAEIVANEKAFRVLLDEATRLGSDKIADSARRGIILSKLRTPEDRDSRMKSIKDAYKDTLKWALGPKDTTSPKWDHLPTWLQSSSSGRYWVSGKAGSGKSTLMKYLLKNLEREDEKVQFPPFRKWAEDSKATVCNFFFKRLGGVHQTSLNGLAQPLVYQVLLKHRHLIEHAVLDMWTSLLDHPGAALEMASTKQMCKAAKRIAESSRVTDTYFCFLIDGLDEYVERSLEDDHKNGNKEAQEADQEADSNVDTEADLLETLINSLVKLPHVKILISSRPTSEYIRMFEEVPKLAMQDLTRGCIDTCIDGKLTANRYIAGLMKTHPKEASKLLDKIAKRASGIFLWVDLACSSLLRGASGNDTLKELEKRVTDLPEELEEMFVHMLNYYNDASHKKQGAQVLEFCRNFH